MNLIKYFLLLAPLFLSFVFSGDVIFSYLIAWSGSIWVFYFSLSGNLKALPTDRSLFQQAMRPLVLPHIIFASYMALSSIFFFFGEMGYTFFDQDPFFIIDWKKIELMAQCQRYYLTGHSFYVIGIVSFMDYQKPKYAINIADTAQFTLTFAIVLIVISVLVQFIPGLSQIAQIVSGVAIVSSILSLAFALPQQALLPKAIAGGLFVVNYLAALTSGWKEAIIVPLILLGTYLYQNYKKTIIIAAPIVIGFYFTYIPAYNSVIRAVGTGGELQGQALVEYAIAEIQSGNVDIAKTNWGFLTGRLSEISMFTEYVAEVPLRIDHYYFQIVYQALESIVPRIFNPDKPNTEVLVMKRVTDIGVISELSIVSAKPAYIVDCYISYGFIGIIVGCFALGGFLSYISVKAESLFGGYVFGSGLFFTGIFMQMWRTNCFEYMANNAFWGLVFLFVFFKVFKSLNVLKKDTS
ncbi:MAG: exosortase Y-associated Wzy-like protein [Cytophagales bacterium]